MILQPDLKEHFPYSAWDPYFVRVTKVTGKKHQQAF